MGATKDVVLKPPKTTRLLYIGLLREHADHIYEALADAHRNVVIAEELAHGRRPNFVDKAASPWASVLESDDSLPEDVKEAARQFVEEIVSIESPPLARAAAAAYDLGDRLQEVERELEDEIHALAGTEERDDG